MIAQNNDYASIEDHLRELNEHNEEALKTGGIVIACGMSKYENEESVATVFERADQRMYENKSKLKSCQDMTEER